MPPTEDESREERYSRVDDSSVGPAGDGEGRRRQGTRWRARTLNEHLSFFYLTVNGDDEERALHLGISDGIVDGASEPFHT